MLMLRLVFRCNNVIFFSPMGNYVRDIYSVLWNIASVYHIVTIRVICTSWAHVWRLQFCLLGLGYDMLDTL
jgi:hypothetical protein